MMRIARAEREVPLMTKALVAEFPGSLPQDSFRLKTALEISGRVVGGLNDANAPTKLMAKTLLITTAVFILTGLLACGSGDAHNSATAAAGSITLTGTMGTARAAHIATLLPSGKVLVAGGMQSEAVSLATAELYDPATGKFTNTGSMTVRRVGPNAVLLRTGKVLIM